MVAPSTTIDLNLETGSDIVIEERPDIEMTSIQGHNIAAKGNYRLRSLAKKGDNAFRGVCPFLCLCVWPFMADMNCLT